MSHRRISFLLLFPFVVLAGCSSLEKSDATKPVNGSSRAVDSGTLVISRAMPSFESLRSGLTALGFVPTPLSRVGRWLGINRTEKTVRVMDGDTPLFSLSAEGLDRLVPGEYQVLHKQKNALWYASDSYFQKRGLPVPAVGDRSRYLRGALGEYSVFLGKDLPIHSGPFWSGEIGGVRVDEGDLSRMYYSVAVGTAVEVQ